MPSRITPRTVLCTFIVFEAAILQSTTLTLTAEEPATLRWPVGGTVRLDYVIEASSDALVTCNVDGRHLSEYNFTVPNKGVYKQERRSLLIERASSRDAGLYECRATAGNVSRVLSWSLRQVGDTMCPTSHVCTEGTGTSCPPCDCVKGNMFYGRNREFRCRRSPWFVGLRFKSQPIPFHHLQLPAIDYELTTFGDTQVNLYLNDVLVHTHTVLVASADTVVTFDERLVMPVPFDPNLVHDGVLEATLRGTGKSTNLTMQIKRVAAVKGMPCDAPTEHFCQAIYTNCTRDRCICDEAVNHWSAGACLHRCVPMNTCVARVPHTTCQRVGHHNLCVCDGPRFPLGGTCVLPECLTELQCQAKYGEHSHCTVRHCTCLAGHVLRDGQCSPVLCLSNEECKDAHMHCVRGKCVCASDYDLLEEQCRKTSVGVCPGNTPCTKANTECIMTQCYCKDGYRPLHLEPGSPCLKITCQTNEDCSSFRGICYDGQCSCPDLVPPSSMTCPGLSLLSAAEVQTNLKLAVCTLGMVVGIIVALAVSIMCMKSKEDYESTVDEDEVVEDQGALMAAKKLLEAVQQGDKDQEPPPEEGGFKILMRSFFPNLAHTLFGVPGDVGHISFGDSTVSESSIDV